MNRKKVIIILSTIAILLVMSVFAINFIEFPNDTSVIFDANVIKPDRIVYKNNEGNYYQFLSGTEQFDKILDVISTSIKTFDKSVESINDDKIDEIHSGSFIELDYKTASKNYIISFEDKNMVKLAESGGNIVTKEVSNISKIKKIADKVSKDEKVYKLEYKSLISRNLIQSIEYKYLQQFKEINYKIHQVKIQDMNTYKLYKEMCNLAFDEEIDESIFEDNDLILTVSLLPKIDVKVNIGNIKYQYDNMENIYSQYTCHLLIVSKIVNTDCIYNKDLVSIDSKVDYDNMKIEYDNKVDGIDSSVFVTDYNKFFDEYDKSSNKITESEAEKIAEKGFEEAERIAGAYEKSTEKVTSKKVKPNNFFTSKINEGHTIANRDVDAYCFTRVDDMELNGVNIYVDKKLGRIIGGDAFGD